jgi:hypothetical protein
MKTNLLGFIACVAMLGATAAAKASPFIETLDQVGANVVATGSGQIDLTGTTFVVSVGPDGGLIDPVDDYTLIGATGSIDLYVPASGFSGPSGYGTGGPTGSSSGSGDLVGLTVFESILFVPAGYSSNTSLSNGATWDNATFASLGATPGIYVWTWGNEIDQSFTLAIEATPLPAALPLFATGLGALGLFGWRRKRKNIAAIAA